MHLIPGTAVRQAGARLQEKHQSPVTDISSTRGVGSRPDVHRPNLVIRQSGTCGNRGPPFYKCWSEMGRLAFLFYMKYLKGALSYTHTHTLGIFHPLSHFPNASDSAGWRQQPDSIQVSRVGQEPTAAAITCFLPGVHPQDAGVRSGDPAGARRADTGRERPSTGPNTRPCFFYLYRPRCTTFPRSAASAAARQPLRPSAAPVRGGPRPPT